MNDDELVTVRSTIDARTPTFCSIFGRKGTGKSFLAARLWSTWPYDRLAIDPTHDAQVGDDVEKITEPVPSSWPWRHDDQRGSYVFQPDAGSPAYVDELDRALGLVWSHPKDDPVLAWLDEVGELTKAGQSSPYMRRILHQGRHRKVSMLMCGPRPIDIDPLVISQSDFVYVFDMPHPRDIDRVGGTIGIKPRELEAAIHQLGEYEYLRYDVKGKQLAHFPALPRRQAPQSHGRA